MNSPVIYLDHAAATPLDKSVLKAMQPYLTDQFFNPSANYIAAKKVRQALDEARASCAHWLGAKPTEIVFTAGGTEANNLAIHGVMRQFPEANIVISSVEHDSVRVPAQNYDCREAAVQADGRVDMADLEQKINDQTVLVSVIYANNEVGTVQPIRELGRLVAGIRRQRQAAGNKLPLYLHSDGCQAANYLDLHAARLGVDLLTINGGKIYGPKQSGLLFVKAGTKLEPLIEGGGQEANLRSGTENLTGAAGLATALDLVQSSRQKETVRLRKLQASFIEMLSTKLPQATINGSRKHRLPNNIHLTIPGVDNERLLIELDEAGVQAAAGSACSASSEESSHVLSAMGLSDAEARASLRLTLGRGTKQSDIRRTADTLSRLLN